MGNASKKLSLFTRQGHTAEILGQTFTFYPVSVRMLFQMRTAFEPLLGALSALFKGQGTENDVQKIVQKETDPTTGQPVEVVQVAAATLDILKLRAEQRAASIKNACDIIFNPENRLMLGRVLADSLRDDFGPGTTDEEVNEFVNHPNMDLDSVIQFVQGFLAANGRVFGPFVGKLQKIVREKLEQALASRKGEGEPSEPQTDGASATTP